MGEVNQKVPFVNKRIWFESRRWQLHRLLDEIGESGIFVDVGGSVSEFEEAIRHVTGTRYAVAVANGTDALEIGLQALGVAEGDQVIVPVNSFIASAGAVRAMGATPVFADVNDEQHKHKVQLSYNQR